MIHALHSLHVIEIYTCIACIARMFLHINCTYKCTGNCLRYEFMVTAHLAAPRDRKRSIVVVGGLERTWPLGYPERPPASTCFLVVVKNSYRPGPYNPCVKWARDHSVDRGGDVLKRQRILSPHFHPKWCPQLNNLGMYWYWVNTSSDRFRWIGDNNQKIMNTPLTSCFYLLIGRNISGEYDQTTCS